MDLLPTLDAAVKENNEAVETGDELQKAKEARAKTRAVLEQRLIGFRRVVRDVLGAHSREFHSLRWKGSGADDQEEDEEKKDDGPGGGSGPGGPGGGGGPGGPGGGGGPGGPGGGG